MIKNQKGITTISLVMTVILIFIILSTIIYSSNNSIEIKNLHNMYTDIRTLEDKIAIYYLNYNEIPVKKGTDGNPKQITNIPTNMSINPNDNNNYYEIDTSLLSNLSLNYSTSEETNDIYIINEQSHTIYYLNGIESEGQIYYTTPIEYTNLDGS